jgi:hypothetical protein
VLKGGLGDLVGWLAGDSKWGPLAHTRYRVKVGQKGMIRRDNRNAATGKRNGNVVRDMYRGLAVGPRVVLLPVRFVETVWLRWSDLLVAGMWILCKELCSSRTHVT